MILTVVSAYVSENNKSVNGFVHSRVKNYIANGIDAKVFVLQNKQSYSYSYEGVDVVCGNVKEFTSFFNSKDISGICCHFLDINMVKALNACNPKCPVAIFVHGAESLMWYERIFPDVVGIRPKLAFAKYAINNIRSITILRRFFRTTKINYKIVCVSNWMRDVAVRNWRIDDKKDKTKIIPNIINEKLFSYEKKEDEQRFNILLIRNFANGKYAPDISVAVIKELSKYSEFERMKIKFIGTGRLYKKYTSQIQSFSNVECVEKVLTQKEVSLEHKNFGLFLCPTRQDAQGVSMCEAMSSGLIPITSNNTAIPEFVPQDCRVALNTVSEMANRILEIMRDSKEFQAVSKKCSSFIQEKCSIEKTTMQEIKLIKSMKDMGE